LTELILDLLKGSNFPVEPRMCFYLGKRQSVGGIKLQHESDKTLEVSLKYSMPLGFPEDVRTVGAQKFVERVGGFTSGEGVLLSEHENRIMPEANRSTGGIANYSPRKNFVIKG
jgi:hypothetical protein